MSDYNTSLPLAGDLKTIQMPSAGADDYFVGMSLAIDAAGKVAYSAMGATNDLQAIALEEKSVAADGYILVAVTGTEWLATGLVDDAGASVTPNLVDKAAFLAAGIIVR